MIEEIFIIIFSIFQIAVASLAIQSYRAAKDTESNSYYFLVSMLVISLIVLLSTLGYIGYQAKSQ
jgi:Na+-driven multidrug efflux pump